MKPTLDPDIICVQCRSAELPSGATAPEWFMVLPAGETEVTPEVDGAAETIRTLVDRDTAAVLNADIKARLAAGGVEPRYSFDHKDTGPASAWPREFQWRDGDKPGVYSRQRWTPEGTKGVTVKAADQLPDYRYFSLSFNFNRRTRRVTGLHPGREVGSLTNEPAFHNIAAVTARDASNNSAAPAADNQNQTTMKKDLIADSVVKAGLITTEEAAGDSVGTLITQRIAALQSDASVKATQAGELATVKAANATLTAEITALKEKRADDAVEAAVKAGKIAPKDDAGKAQWKKNLVADYDGNAAVLAKMGKVTPDETKADTPGVKGDDGNPDEAAVKARGARVSERALKLQAAGMDWTAAFNQADKDEPAL